VKKLRSTIKLSTRMLTITLATRVPFNLLFITLLPPPKMPLWLNIPILIGPLLSPRLKLKPIPPSVLGQKPKSWAMF